MTFRRIAAEARAVGQPVGPVGQPVAQEPPAVAARDAEPATGQQGSPRSPTSPMVTFPQIAKLELDELLVQVLDRTREVLDTQGRLRGLLAANRAIAEDLHLPVLLRRIVESGCELVSARYGALGVVGPDRRLTEFVTVGLDDHILRHVGHLPHERGVLGRLLTDPRPLRLNDVRTHPDAVGTPTGHPMMNTFLGVPIRVGEQVFGNLYLAEKTPEGEFTADDEEVLTALAAAAGIAIKNAVLYDASRRRHHAHQAAQRIAGQVLAGRGDPLPLIAAQARRLTEADLAAILVPTDADTDGLRIAAASGIDARSLTQRRLPLPWAVAAQTTSRPPDPAALDALASSLATVAPRLRPGPTITASLAATDGRTGILHLSRVPSAPPFTSDDKANIRDFAGHLGLALELAHASTTGRRLQQDLRHERDRAARDLGATLLPQLLAATLGLTNLAATTPDPAAKQDLRQIIETLDDAISPLRQTTHPHPPTAANAP